MRDYTKKNVAVLAGGNSSEFFISLKSAKVVSENINKNKYNVFEVQIKGIEWILTNYSDCCTMINKKNFTFEDNGIEVKFDCVFSLIHGTPGEDGLLQGYFDMLNIPYVGCGVLCSALTFNKYYCNSFLKNIGIGINVAKSVLVRKNKIYDVDNIINKTGLPCFVKPNASGSSFGITKVKHRKEIKYAIEKAFKESEEVIIEQYIKGDEIQCGLFKTKKEIYILPLVEIISKNEFFDFLAKYNSEYVTEIIPARISDDLTTKCGDISTKIYDALNCKGIVRIDFILKEKEFWLLEANTIPGMTNESVIPQMIMKTEMTFTEVLDILIDDLFLEK